MPPLHTGVHQEIQWFSNTHVACVKGFGLTHRRPLSTVSLSKLINTSKSLSVKWVGLQGWEGGQMK